MGDPRYSNQRYRSGVKDPLAVLQRKTQSWKNDAEDIDVLVNQCIQQTQKYLTKIDYQIRLIEQLKSENALLNHCNEDRIRYRRERDEARREKDKARQTLNNFDIPRLQYIENEVNDLRQALARKAREKDDETKRCHASIDERNRMRQYLEEKLRERDFKIKQLEGRLYNQAETANDRSSSGRATHERGEQMIYRLREQLQQALTRLKETQAELDDTKTRLSKVMGDRLTDNNPNIADLSDKNRPIKLAERYAELYDNQWTNAFDVINRYFPSEEQTVGALRDILQDIMAFCKKNGNIQMDNLRFVVAFSNSAQQEESVFPVNMNKQLKDFRKAMSSVALTNLYKMYISRLEQSLNRMLKPALEITPYVKECVELCWLMVVQDPPVVLATMAERGSALNTDVYKPYVSSGTHVEYVVWPALLLHEGGPVLAKGIAQGYGKQPRKKNVTTVYSRGKANEETGLGNGIARGLHNRSQNDGRDSQYDRYAQVGSSSGLVNRSSRNSDTVRDDRKRNQRVATVGPMQMASS